MTPVVARLTADERRDEIVAAASIEFARAGFSGGSTAAIASRVGVSQPYLFQLFGTKKELFLATVRSCFARTRRTFEAAAREARAEGLDSAGVLIRMGEAYKRFLRDRDVLRLQLQAYAACGDPEVRAVVRDNYLALWQAVAAMTGASPAAVHAWFAEGMLINVIASIDDAMSEEEFEKWCAFGGPAATK